MPPDELNTDINLACLFFVSLHYVSSSADGSVEYWFSLQPIIVPEVGGNVIQLPPCMSHWIRYYIGYCCLYSLCQMTPKRYCI